MKNWFQPLRLVAVFSMATLHLLAESPETARPHPPKPERPLRVLTNEMSTVTNALRGTRERPPLVSWGQRILECATQRPANDEQPAYLIYNYLFWCWEMDPRDEENLLSEMARSPNDSVRKLAAARTRLGELRATPWKLQFTALDGREVTMESLRGKVVLVDGWSIWCGSCVEALPRIKRLHEQYRDQGFEVIGICFALESERDEAKSRKVIEEKKADWPMWMLRDAAADQFVDRYGIVGFPATWLFDREGRLVSSRGLTEELMEPAIRKALGLPPLASP